MNEEKKNWGGARAGAGRPKGALGKNPRPAETLRNARIILSCTEDEKAKLKELAASHGKNVTEYILDTLLK